jgi:hypothetical protein
MLEQILDFIHNYFIKEVYRGTFKIENGILVVDFLLDGQYFKINGSLLNEGIYQYPINDLKDEEFKGEIWSMAVPKSITDLAIEIEGWQREYGDKLNSPFQSESFGGYSYSKASGTDSKGNSLTTWQGVFGSRLNAYRKLS